jgi:hypothetical protein
VWHVGYSALQAATELGAQRPWAPAPATAASRKQAAPASTGTGRKRASGGTPAVGGGGGGGGDDDDEAEAEEGDAMDAAGVLALEGLGKKARQPRLTLKETHLLGERGLWAVYSSFPKRARRARCRASRATRRGTCGRSCPCTGSGRGTCSQAAPHGRAAPGGGLGREGSDQGAGGEGGRQGGGGGTECGRLSPRVGPLTPPPFPHALQQTLTKMRVEF